ncbi:hypothetical protein CL656_03250 [bacterium]|nr:hypothetical protein [bacterium]|tara:strand:- start:442 stop:750 length:309 start_codon:yes stop_codon:yes gene_type:complete
MHLFQKFTRQKTQDKVSINEIQNLVLFNQNIEGQPKSKTYAIVQATRLQIKSIRITLQSHVVLENLVHLTDVYINRSNLELLIKNCPNIQRIQYENQSNQFK